MEMDERAIRMTEYRLKGCNILVVENKYIFADMLAFKLFGLHQGRREP